MKAWPHQLRSIEQCRREFAAGNHQILLTAPCGAGKTFMSKLLIDGALAKSKRALFLAPRRDLVDQTVNKFREYGLSPGCIMAGRTYEPWKPLSVSSVDSLMSWCFRGSQTIPQADLLVVDEAHVFGGKARAEVIEHYRKAGAAIIGMTATPVGAGGKPLGDQYETMVVSATYSELIANGVLVGGECYCPTVADMTGVRSVGGDWEPEEAAKRMLPIVGCVVSHWKKLGENRQTILFAPNVAQAQWFAEQFRADGIPADHVHGGLSSDERDPIYERFRNGDIRVLCNCDVISFGNDFPMAEVVVNTSPTKSLRNWIQRMGRVLRSCPEIGKQKYILIDHTGSIRLHGPPDLDREWQLNELWIDAKGKEPKPPEPSVIICPKCSHCRMKGPECPVCGHVAHKKSKSPQVKEGKLSKYEGNGQETIIDDQKVWSKSVARAFHRNGSFYMALKLFRQETGHSPPRDLRYMPSPDEFPMKVSVVFPDFGKRKKVVCE